MLERVILKPQEFNNLFGFESSQIPQKIIISPTINRSLIKNIPYASEHYKTLWYYCIRIKLKKSQLLIFKTLPGYTHHIDLINFLLPFIRPATQIYFLGAVGILDEKIKLNQFFSIQSSTILNQNSFQIENKNALHLSLPYMSIENQENLRQWKSQGIKTIDLEIGYLDQHLEKQGLNLETLVYGTDYPLKGQTFLLNHKNFHNHLLFLKDEFNQWLETIDKS